MIDRERFERALALANAPTPTCIGTLSERVTHRVLKYYFEPDPNFHEVKYLGSVADIKNSDGIIEIQTKGLDRLRGKLHKFLPTVPVSVVYPVSVCRKLSWLDPTSGELTPPRTAPRKGRLSDGLKELRHLREFVGREGFTVIIVLVNAYDVKPLRPFSKNPKRGAERTESIPTELLDVVCLRSVADYGLLIPESLGDEFTAAEFSSATALRGFNSFYSLRFLMDIGLLDRYKKGRSFIYSRTELGKMQKY